MRQIPLAFKFLFVMCVVAVFSAVVFFFSGGAEAAAAEAGFPNNCFFAVL